MARAKLSVSEPTSRWLMIERLSACRYSIGSSSVMMCSARVELMWSIIAASVVDLPEPVVPVSRMIPRRSSARVRIAGGRPRSSIVRTWKGITRQTIETEPRWRKALTRKRETLGIE